MRDTRIWIEAYSPTWASTFEQLRTVYLTHLADLIADVQHVGSTSVVGLAAKPIIDIDLIISHREKLGAVIQKLDGLGYDYQGDLGITDREAFRARSDQAPFEESVPTWPKHHLYVCIAGSISVKNHIAFRDFLRHNPATAKRYEDLKKRLSLEHPYDMDRYVEGKTPFITAVLKAVGFDEEAINSISQNNSLDNSKRHRRESLND